MRTIPRNASSAGGNPLAQAFQIYAPSTIYSVGLGAMTPAIATAALDLGANAALAAAIVVMIGVGGLIGNGPAALATDRWGERATIIGSALLGTLGALVAWAASARWFSAGDSEGLGLGLLVAAVALVGAAGAGFNLARQSYLAAVVPVSHRARAMSALGGVMRIGVLVGPFLGAALQGVMGLQGAFVTAAAAMAVGVAMSLFIKDLEPEDVTCDTQGIPLPTETLRHMAIANRRLLGTVGLCVSALAAARAARNAVIPLWGTHLGLEPATVSLVFGFVGLVDLLMFYPAGWLMDRFGRRAVAVPCLSLIAVGFATMPFTGSIGWFVATALLIGFGNGFGSGIVMTLGADYSPRHGRAQFLGVWRIVADAGMITGPLLLSAVTATVSLGAGIGVLAVITGAGAVGLLRWLPGGPGPVAQARRDVGS